MMLSIFYVFIGHFYIFFGEMSMQAICPLKKLGYFPFMIEL